MTLTLATRAVRSHGPFLVLVLFVSLLASPSANDFFQFWWAGHLIVTGRSPYDPDAWAAALAYGPAAGAVAARCVVSDSAACSWIYPPWTAWLFVPTGALDPQTGIAIQRVTLVSALAVGGVLWVRAARATGAAGASLLVAFAASAPFVRDVVTGHFEGLLLIGLALVAIGLADRRTWPVVAGAMLVALKPHLSFALVPLVVVWLVSTRAYRTLTVAAVALCALAVAGFTSDPLAWPALIGRTIAKQQVATGTTWGFAAAIGGAAAPAVAVVMVAAAAAAAFTSWRSSGVADRAGVLVGAGAALSLAVAPYAQSYDMVLLFPAVAIALATVRRAAAVTAAAVVVAVTWLAYILELSGDPRAFAGALPTIALVLLALRARRRPSVALDRTA
ncbi:MAG: glycosyltransferase 87 family protein [Chloroflexota bacterium]|nr:glycosyltransferase 87 family protein [Chloroflexota bacterium]